MSSKKSFSNPTVIAAIIGAIAAIIVACVSTVLPSLIEKKEATKEGDVAIKRKITGLVLDESTRKPITGAKVAITNMPGFVDVMAYTTSEGTFSFDLPIDQNTTVRIRVEVEGYEVYDRDVDIIFDNLRFADIRLKSNSPEPMPSMPIYSEMWTIGYFDNIDLEGEIVYQKTIYAEKNEEGGFFLKLDSAFEAARDEKAPKNNYSVKITGKFPFKTGKYEFTCKHADGCKIDVAGRNWIDVWWDSDVDSLARDITEGTHIVDIEFYDITGQGLLEVYWRLVK